MRLAGRLSAAIEVLDEISGRHRPASEALKDWGKAHRFAGSGDRHAIGTLVYDALRRRNSFGAHMADGASRSLVLAAARFEWKVAAAELARSVGEEHGPGTLSADEEARLAVDWIDDERPWIAGDYPEWLQRSFARAFGEAAARQGQALARRAPVDLRVNTLKADRGKLIAALARYAAGEGPLSPWCVRIAPPGHEARNANVEAEPAHGKGWFEIQDAASQVAVLLTGARPGEQVADICAGAGGKTLALAALLENKGQIFAYDSDRHRLRPIFERLQRAEVRNVQVIGADETDKLDALKGRIDCAVADAPCTGSGTWRRKPDAKWRLTEKQLQQRLRDQDAVLERGANLVKMGGRLAYFTCSVLPEENQDRIAAFLTRHPDFQVIPYRQQWTAGEPPESAGPADGSLLLTPADHGTDGFFVCILRRAA